MTGESELRGHRKMLKEGEIRAQERWVKTRSEEYQLPHTVCGDAAGILILHGSTPALFMIGLLRNPGMVDRQSLISAG